MSSVNYNLSPTFPQTYPPPSPPPPPMNNPDNNFSNNSWNRCKIQWIYKHCKVSLDCYAYIMDADNILRSEWRTLASPRAFTWALTNHCSYPSMEMRFVSTQIAGFKYDQYLVTIYPFPIPLWKSTARGGSGRPRGCQRSISEGVLRRFQQPRAG